MKIKSVIKKEEVIEKEISLPYFCKYDDSPFSPLLLAVYSENEIMAIRNGTGKSISFYPNNVYHAEIAKAEECTEQEFNDVYHEILMTWGKYVPAPSAPKELLNQAY